MTMHVLPGLPSVERDHRWVAAAVVEVGRGPRSARAEHASRTGRHVLPAATRIEVLEVYCADCRVAYASHESTRECAAVATAASASQGGAARGTRPGRSA